jgi:hypothetical protein
MLELARFLRLRFRESDGLHRSPEIGPDGVYRGDVSNDERSMERPARTKRRTQICCLGGRSFSSDITMPLRLTTACACLAALWRADLQVYPEPAEWAQSPPCGVDPKREIGAQPPNSNRSYKWRFGEPNQPARPPALWRLIYGTGIRNRAKPLKT